MPRLLAKCPDWGSGGMWGLGLVFCVGVFCFALLAKCFFVWFYRQKLWDFCVFIDFLPIVYYNGDIIKWGWRMFLTVEEVSLLWGVSQRSVRNYCAVGLVDGAVLVGGRWRIPEGTKKPVRRNAGLKGRNSLLARLKAEKTSNSRGGIYHKLQVDLTYNSNHIEGSKLSHEETRYIFETNTILGDGNVLHVDDIIETANHFRCIDFVIDKVECALSENFIKTLHERLKVGTSDSRKDWFSVGGYKKLPNQVGGMETTPPELVEKDMAKLISDYNSKDCVTLDDILDFHYQLECMHPFQDGNGRVGRLIMLKECLKHGIVPFVILESHKIFYYRGLKEWGNERGFFRETCLFAQDFFKKDLEYFRIKYKE